MYKNQSKFVNRSTKCSVSKPLTNSIQLLKYEGNIVKLSSPFFGSGTHTKYIGKFIAFHAFCHICLNFVGSFGQRQLLPFGCCTHKKATNNTDMSTMWRCMRGRPKGKGCGREVAYLKLTMSAWKWQKTLRKLLARNFEWPIGCDRQPGHALLPSCNLPKLQCEKVWNTLWEL